MPHLHATLLLLVAAYLRDVYSRQYEQEIIHVIYQYFHGWDVSLSMSYTKESLVYYKLPQSGKHILMKLYKLQCVSGYIPFEPICGEIAKLLRIHVQLGLLDLTFNAGPLDQRPLYDNFWQIIIFMNNNYIIKLFVVVVYKVTYAYLKLETDEKLIKNIEISISMKQCGSKFNAQTVILYPNKLTSMATMNHLGEILEFKPIRKYWKLWMQITKVRYTLESMVDKSTTHEYHLIQHDAPQYANHNCFQFIVAFNL